MMSLLLAIHMHAAQRGEGLLPEFLGPTAQPRRIPEPMNGNPVKGVESKAGPRSNRQVRHVAVSRRPSGPFTIR